MHSVSDPRSVLWHPSGDFRESSEMFRFMEWLKDVKKLVFQNYENLWKWSVGNKEEFWLCVWEFYEIMYDGGIEQVLTTSEMPGARWFTGTRLNYTEHVFRNAAESRPALMYCNEQGGINEMSWKELERRVSALQSFLIGAGVKKGDRVAGYLCNTPEATISFLATVSLGAVWSLCSPDFGTHSVVDRFRQIEPTVLIATTRYSYNGRSFDKKAEIKEIAGQLPLLKQLVITEDIHLPDWEELPGAQVTEWKAILSETSPKPLHFERVPFNAPLWILYSSGTTGIPKAITQSQGGVLIEHLKFMGLHGNVKKNDRYFWYTTTGWVMWNLLQSSLLLGATAVLYDGSVAYPSLNKLWDLAEQAQLTTLGVSAAYILTCQKQNLHPLATHNLQSLKCIGSTGSVLPESGAGWIYRDVKPDIWLASISGGTDISSGFVAGNPMLPVHSDALQCRALGCSLAAYDPDGNAVINRPGEMVITQPMPSMPLYFWGEKDNSRYRASYFDVYPGIWRHGDNIIVFEDGTVEILGRSDATLNRMGVRIGTSEIYQSVEKNPEIKDSLVVNIELDNGEFYMPLFVVLETDADLTEELKTNISKTLRSEYSPRHVPDEIMEVRAIPYTLNGKKMEVPVKRILKGEAVEKVVSKDAMRNPDSLDYFIDLSKELASKRS